MADPSLAQSVRPPPSGMQFDGRRIKAAAAQAGMSLSELASSLEVTRSTLYAYVAGTIQPPAARIQQIARVTGTDVGFFSGEGSLARAVEDVRHRVRLAEAMLVGADPESAASILGEVSPALCAPEQGSLAIRIAAAFVGSGQYAEAIPWCYRARDSFAETNDLHGMGRAAQTLGFLFSHIGPLSAADRAFREAEKLLDLDHKWKPRVAFAVLDERRGHLLEALERTSELLLTEPSSYARLYALGARGDVLAKLERWEDAELVEQEAIDVADRLGARDQIGERLVALCTVAVYRGDLNMDSWLARTEGFFLGSADRGRRAHFLTVQSLAHLRQGDFEAAGRAAQQGLNLAIEGQYRRAEIAATLRVAQIACHQGLWLEARWRAEQAESLSRTYEYATESWHAQALAAFASRGAGERMASIDADRCPVPSLHHVLHALNAPKATIDSVTDHLRSQGFDFTPGFLLS